MTLQTAGLQTLVQVRAFVEGLCTRTVFRDLPTAAADIRLLAEMDVLHGTLTGPATRKPCARQFKVFGDASFERWSGLSNGHRYTRCQHKPYRAPRGG